MNKHWIIVEGVSGEKIVFDYAAIESIIETKQPIGQGETRKGVAVTLFGGRGFFLSGTVDQFLKQIGVEDPKPLQVV